MAANSKTMGTFVLTPHKVSVCILITIYAPPSQSAVPFPFSSIPQHNRLGLFLFSVTKVNMLATSPLPLLEFWCFCFSFIHSTQLDF